LGLSYQTENASDMTTSDLTPIRANSTWIGVSWMVVTGLLFVCVTGIVRYVGSSIPAAEAAFIRYAIGLAMMSPFLIPALRRGMTKRKLALYSGRGLVHSLGVILWFYAMANIPIAEVVAIGYTAPIFVTIGAALIFGEKLAARRIMAVGFGFLGALVIIRPGFHEIGSGQWAQIISAPLFAISYLIAKRLSEQESPTEVVGMLSVFVTLGIAPFAFVVWQTPSISEVLWLGLVAAFATAGHITMTKALAAAPLMVTQPITFLQLVWATMLGALVFHEAVDIWVLLGGGIIIASVSFISYREWVVTRSSRTPPPSALK
jgi:drug/metabolite transporter (DMT)-like permease